MDRDRSRVDNILDFNAAKADDILNASDASLTANTTPNSSITDTSSSSAANTPVDSPESKDSSPVEDSKKGSGKSRFKYNYL